MSYLAGMPSTDYSLSTADLQASRNAAFRHHLHQPMGPGASVWPPPVREGHYPSWKFGPNQPIGPPRPFAPILPPRILSVPSSSELTTSDMQPTSEAAPPPPPPPPEEEDSVLIDTDAHFVICGTRTANLTRQQAYSLVEVFTALDPLRTARLDKSGLYNLIQGLPQWSAVPGAGSLLLSVAHSPAITMGQFATFCDAVAGMLTPSMFNKALTALENPTLVPPGFPSSLTMSQESAVIQLFEVIDADKNGYIEKHELVQFYGADLAPQIFDKWNLKGNDEIINLFEMCKFFNDLAGTVTRKEFAGMIKKLANKPA